MDEAVLTTGGKDPGLEELLSAGLDTHNLAASGVAAQQEFTVKVEDGSGLVAGLSAWSWGPVAGLAMVWVRADSRRSGWGGRLLAAAEQEARRRGCTRVFVSSFTFQAPAFYERHGYTEVARVSEYPVDGAADVYLVKQARPRRPLSRSVSPSAGRGPSS